MNNKNFLILAAVLVLTAGCSQKQYFPVSSVVPATQAKAVVDTDRNGNAVIDVKVKHLAPPENLSPPAAHYIVWVETADHRVVNMGRLVVNSRLSGRLQATSPLREFRVLVTAEDSAMPSIPSGQVVLRTDMFRIDE